jgi:hypothetical protein
MLKIFTSKRDSGYINRGPELLGEGCVTPPKKSQERGPNLPRGGRGMAESQNVLNIKGLLTESEVCTGKYLPEIFVQTERRKSEVCADKPKANIFPYRPSKTRLINRLLYGSLNTFSDFHIFV